MGVKGLIRDLIMFFVGLELVTKGVDSYTLGIILIISAVIFTVWAYLKAFGLIGV